MKPIIQEEIEQIKAQKAEGTYVDLITLGKRIKERRFTVKDIGANYRWIDHWYSEGLLLNSYEKGKWRKFNLIEFVWLKIIIKIRDFNISLKTVKSVKDILDSDFTGDDLSKTPGYNSMEIIPQIGPSDKLQIVQKILKEEKVQKEIKETHFNLFEVIIMDILTLGSWYSILIDPDGVIIPIKHSYLELFSDIPEFKNLICKSFVSISITEILRDYIIEKDIDLNNKRRLAVLTEQESIVLETIRRDDLKSVIIKFDNNKKMNLLEEVKEEKIDKAARLLELIMTNGYQDITIKTQNGNIVYCENKKKKIIR